MLVIMLSLALAAASTDAAGAAATGAVTTEAVKPVKPRKVCQRIESTGSSVPKKVCRTVEAPKVDAEAANGVAVKPSGTSTN